MGRIGFGFALFVLFALLAIGPPRPREEPQPLVGVLVARRHVPAFEALKEPEKWFKIAYYSKGDEPLDAVTDFAQVKDQRLVRRLVEDQPLKKTDIADSPAAGIYVGSPEGTRAVALPIELGLTDLLRPGIRVDVAVLTTSAAKESSCKIVVENLVLLTFDKGKDVLPTTATVAITLEQAVKLLDAVKVGKLNLVLRPPTIEQAGDKPAWAFAVPNDLRGVTVRYNEVQCHSFILPGCRYDVIVTKETSDKEFVVETLVENVVILATGLNSSTDMFSAAVTLAVPKEQVEKLLAGAAEGETRLSLRPPDDKSGTPLMKSKLADWKKPVNQDMPPDK